MEKRPRGNDEERESGGSIWDRVTSITGIQPVMGNPGFEGTGRMHEVADMAGWAGEDGQDALLGVGKMATGEIDATQELDAPSQTNGGPLELADGESAFDDRHNTGVMTTGLTPEEKRFDWCADL
jgi:hypothetical protein